MQTDETRAREVLAAEYRKDGYMQMADGIEQGQSPATIRAMLAFQSEARATPADGEREASAWLVEENAGSGIIHWIALDAGSWPRTKIRRRARPTIRSLDEDDDDFELEDYQTPVRRVKDANEALRFARKEDADAFIALFDRFLLCPVATEHQWPSLAALPPATEKAKK